MPIALLNSHFARGLDGFRLRTAVALQSTGIPSLDAILDGGVPRGSIVELCGTASSGRTSLSFSLLAKATERQEVCAYVDVSDSLDPLSLASAGVDLQRLLWIRCGSPDTISSPQPRETLSRMQPVQNHRTVRFLFWKTVAINRDKPKCGSILAIRSAASKHRCPRSCARPKPANQVRRLSYW